MAAGLGFKTFNTGDVLSASDVNGYLMQGVLVFASTAARDAAITAPAEGQFAFTKDTNSLFYYDGAAWVASGATGDIEGVTAGTGISGGGTSGTVTITNSMATAIDAKGDLIGGTGADTFARLAVGANDTVLTADSTTATGLKWAAPAGGGGMTLLNTGGTALSSTTTTINITTTGYAKLEIYLVNVYCSSDAVLCMRLNGDTGSNYTFQAAQQYNVTGSTVVTRSAIDSSRIVLGVAGSTNNYSTRAMTYVQISRPGETENKVINYFCRGRDTSHQNSEVGSAAYNSTTAISSVTFNTDSVNTFSGGTVYIYGVK